MVDLLPPSTRLKRSALLLASAAWLMHASAQAPASAPLQAPISSSAPSRQAQPLATDPVLEAKVLRVAAELRCLVCQNETIAASQADLAVDLRSQIRQKLQGGESEAAILDFMVARYGDFVLYRPRFAWKTWLLWLGPFALLLVAGLSMAWHIRRRRPSPEPTLKLSETQEAQAKQLLGLSPTSSEPSPSP